MSSCCSTSDIDNQPCPRCGHVGLIVGTGPVRAHRPAAVDGAWQYCTNEHCDVVFHLRQHTVEVDSVRTQVGRKATAETTPVCFCFAHTADDLADDLAGNDGVSTIKASIKAAVTAGECACEHLNPSGQCCLADVHRTLTSIAETAPIA